MLFYFSSCVQKRIRDKFSLCHRRTTITVACHRAFFDQACQMSKNDLYNFLLSSVDGGLKLSVTCEAEMNVQPLIAIFGQPCAAPFFVLLITEVWLAIDSL
jgi:hypothetical protein